MIRLHLGNVGSGKSLCAVREMVMNRQGMSHYTNIIPKKPRLTPHIKKISPDMIVSKVHVKDTKHKDGTVTPEYKLEFNKEFWRKVPKPLSVWIDEAHEMYDARRAMSKVNQIMSNFSAMIRRILGETDAEGDFNLITQLDRRIDVIVRDMAHQVIYYVCYYWKSCVKCGVSWQENSEMADKRKWCPICGHHVLKKSSFVIRARHFAGIKSYDAWKEFGVCSWYKDESIRNVSDYFKYYDTVQWENFLTELYG